MPTPTRNALFAVIVSVLGGCAWHTADVAPDSAVREAALSQAAWDSLDLDGSGHLDRDELRSRRAVGLLQDFNRADRDSDGHVSRGEWELWWPHMRRTPTSADLARLNAGDLHE